MKFDLKPKRGHKIKLNLTPFKYMTFPKQVQYWEDYRNGLREWIDVTYKVGDNGNADKVNIEREIKIVNAVIDVLHGLNIKPKKKK